MLIVDGPVGGSKREANGGGALETFEVPATDEFWLDRDPRLDCDLVPLAFALAGARGMKALVLITLTTSSTNAVVSGQC